MHNRTYQKSSYRPDVDGLRAVSVIGVILFHAGVGFPGGYVGVDLFFVISGFLITGIIQRGIDEQTFTLSGFWARRFRRILPASLMITVSTLIAGWVIFLPYDLHELGEAAFAHGAFASNVYHWHQLKDYFASEAELRPLLHTWSLAVEEQFYFLYPFLLLSLRGLLRGRRMLVLAGIAAASLALSALGAYKFPHANFFLLPTRAWELLVGALIALWGRPSNLGNVSYRIMAYGGFLLIIVSMLLYDDGTPFPGAAAVLPVMGAGLLIFGNDCRDNLVCRILSMRPIVFVGLISYSLYLWHWPLIVFAKYISGGDLTVQMLAGVLCLTVILSMLSWRFIEVPFRKAGVERRPMRAITAGLVLTIVTCIWSLSLMRNGGAPGRFAGQKLVTEDAAFENSSYFRTNAGAVPTRLPVIGCAGTTCLPSRVLLWGDSHAPPVVDCLDGLLKQEGVQALVAAKSATAPIIESDGVDSVASLWNNAVLSYIQNDGISAVIIVSRWSSWLTDDATFESVKERLTLLSNNGVKVYLLQQVPEQPFNVSRAIYSSKFGMPIPTASTLSEHNTRQSVANDYLKRLHLPSVRLLDPTPFCFDEYGIAKIGDRDRAFYRDDDHLSSYGAEKLLTPLFEDVIAEIAKTASK